MRVLQVSDSNALDRDATEVRDALVLSMNTGTNELREKTRMAVECIPAGISLEFTVSLNDKVFSDFRAQNQDQLPFTSLDELFEQISRFAAFEWRTDQDFFGRIVKPGGISTAEIARFYQGVQANFRLGWGSGLSGTTIMHLLPVDLRLRIRDKLFDYRPTNVFPKSRRVLAQDGLPAQSLGWTKIRVVQ